MKRIISVFMLVGILIFVSSCEKERSSIPTENQSQFKAADEDPIHLQIPTITGQVSIPSGLSRQDILITLEGLTLSYYSSTHPDINGNYSFNNLEDGTYIEKVYEDNTLTNTTTYVIE